MKLKSQKRWSVGTFITRTDCSQQLPNITPRCAVVRSLISKQTLFLCLSAIEHMTPPDHSISQFWHEFCKGLLATVSGQC